MFSHLRAAVWTAVCAAGTVLCFLSWALSTDPVLNALAGAMCGAGAVVTFLWWREVG